MLNKKIIGLGTGLTMAFGLAAMSGCTTTISIKVSKTEENIGENEVKRQKINLHDAPIIIGVYR